MNFLFSIVDEGDPSVGQYGSSMDVSVTFSEVPMGDEQGCKDLQEHLRAALRDFFECKVYTNAELQAMERSYGEE